MKQKNVCNGLKFSDCELLILRMAVDKAEEKLVSVMLIPTILNR